MIRILKSQCHPRFQVWSMQSTESYVKGKERDESGIGKHNSWAESRNGGMSKSQKKLLTDSPLESPEIMHI